MSVHPGRIDYDKRNGKSNEAESATTDRERMAYETSKKFPFPNQHDWQQNLFSILFFLIVPFVITFYWIDKPLENVIEQKIGDSAREALTLINFNVEIILQDMLKSSVEISKNPDVITLLKDPGRYSEYEKLRLKNDVLNNMFSSFFSDTYITLTDMKGTWYSTRYIDSSQYSHIVQKPWYQEMLSGGNQLRWMFNYQDFLYIDNRPIISLVRTITDPATNEDLGLLIYGVAERDFRNYLSTLEGEVYLIDDEDTVVSSPVTAMIGSSVSAESYMEEIWKRSRGQHIAGEGEDKRIVNFDTLHQTGWKIVQVIPYDTVFKEIFDIRKINIGIVLVIFFLFMMITLSISYRMSKPLKLLTRKMQSAEKTNFNSMLKVTGPREISTLIGTYNKMAEQIRRLLERLKQEFQQKEDMRFKALQAQINPHFILNTLNNIKWMAYIKQDREVGDMLSSLGTILESSIGRDGSSLIPLKQEIHYIENYISLMKLKYNEKLTVCYSIPDELMNCEVIKFCLQPILENSISHGIDYIAGQGEIHIKAQEIEGRLILSVRDNGIGMSEEKLRQVTDGLSCAAEEGKEKRIGIRNVHDRIRLQYGNGYGVRVRSWVNEGTIVELVLPSIKREGTANGSESAAG
ncbi:sensor histidine kinase [Paenibacillus senegalensis]|uniref:sensor histidine kinase n=1 Tax=Paenibacillus senegalensis TaxID=1465766 RepID=UPI0002882CCE|nr:sensor histidine kinase [Paenibacillus senegalensis]